jgi:hypothetical protein
VARSGGGRGQPARINFTYTTYTYPTWRQPVQPDIPEIGSAVVSLLSTVTVQKTVATSVICSLGIIGRGVGQKNVPQVATTPIGLATRTSQTRGGPGGQFVTAYSVAYNTTTTPKTVSVTVAPGDALVIIGETFVGTNTLSTPTGGTGITYTLKQSIVAVASQNNLYLWTSGISASSQTFTMSISMAGPTNTWGYTVLRFSNIASIGASNKGNGTSSAPSISLTTTGANSLIVCGDTDWRGSPSSATYLTGAGTAIQAFTDTSGGGGTLWCWYHTDAGSIGAKTVGMSAPSQNWGIAGVELVPSGTVDNRAQTATVGIGALALPMPKKSAPTIVRGPVGLAGYRTIYSIAESGQSVLGISALVTSVKNAVVAVRAAVGMAGRATDVKTVSTQTSGSFSAAGRVTVSRVAAVFSRTGLGAFGRVAGMARSTPVIAVIAGGVTSRPAVLKTVVANVRAPVGWASSSTPRKVAIVADRVPIGLVGLRSGTLSIPTRGFAAIGVTMQITTAKRSPVAVSAPVGALGATRAAKSSAQRVSNPVGAAGRSQVSKRAVVVLAVPVGVLSRPAASKRAVTGSRAALGIAGYAPARKVAIVYTQASIGIAGLAGVRKSVASTARAWLAAVPRVQPAKAITTSVSMSAGLLSTDVFVLPPWPPHAVTITVCRSAEAGAVALTTTSQPARTELTGTGRATTEITEPAQSNTEITRIATGDTDLTH